MDLVNEQLEIARLSNEDVTVALELFQLFREVFDEEDAIAISEEYLSSLLEKADFIVLCIRCKGIVVGGLTAYELPMHQFEGAEMFIYDIAIKPDYQRRGLGKKLLQALEEYCKQKGISQIFVDASVEDLHALDFYQSSGGKGEKVVQFTFRV